MRQTSVNYARVLAELSVPADDLRNAAAMLKDARFEADA